MDLPYLVALQRRNSEAIGFVPRAGLEGIITGDGPFGQPRHRIWVAEVSADPVGFLYASPGEMGGTAKIVQICLQEDARRREYGSALVARVEEWALGNHRSAVGCTNASELEAAAFWEALGYEVRRTEVSAGRRGRLLEVRRRLLSLPLRAEDGV